MLIALVLTVSTLGLCVYASSRVPALKDWIYRPIAEFYHLVRFGS